MPQSRKKTTREDKAKDELEIKVQGRTKELGDTNEKMLLEIAERKKIQKALLEIEEKYRLLVENTETGFVVVDDTGVVVEANEPYLRLVGAESMRDIIGHSVIEWTAPESKEENAAAVARCAEEGHVQDFETIYLHPDGSRVNILINAIMHETSEGKRLTALCRDITERKRIEEALKESEYMLQSIFRSAPIGIGLVSNRIIKWTNEKLCSMVGYSSEEMVGKNARMIYPSDEDYEYVGRIKYAQIRELGTGTVETRWQCKDGKVIDILLSSTPLDPDDLTIGVTFTALDITERKRVEEERIRQNTLMNNILASLTYPFYVIDANDYTIKLANSAAKLDSLSGEKTCYAHTHQRTSPCEDNERPCILKMIKETKKPFTTEYTYYDREGNPKIIEIHGFPIFESDGNVTQIIKYTMDITERKNAEKELAERENFLSNVFSSIQDGISVLDNDMNIIRVNPVIEKWYSHAMPLMGKKCYQAYHEQGEPCEVCPTRRTLYTGESAYEVVPKRSRGSEIIGWLDLYSFPLIDLTTGEIKGVIEYVRDITERKMAEKEREHLNIELARKNRELEQVVYVTSHDLRTPLVNIHGFSKELSNSVNELVSIFQSDRDPEDARAEISSIVDDDIPEALKYITMSISKMDSLLYGLLKLSRLGLVEINNEHLNMNRLMSDISNTHKFQLKEAGVTLKISELPPCIGDEAQINQVFSNLLDNALKYIDPERPGIIKVSGHKEGGQSIYCIEDNGIGIAPKHQEKIFEIFYQLEPGESSGEGLGLTIVHKILDRLHGIIWVESEPGKGSKFYISLPA